MFDRVLKGHLELMLSERWEEVQLLKIYRFSEYGKRIEIVQAPYGPCFRHLQLLHLETFERGKWSCCSIQRGGNPEISLKNSPLPHNGPSQCHLTGPTS